MYSFVSVHEWWILGCYLQEIGKQNGGDFV